MRPKKIYPKGESSAKGVEVHAGKFIPERQKPSMITKLLAFWVQRQAKPSYIGIYGNKAE